MTQQSHCWAYTEATIIERDMCAPMFIAALFTTARPWKQPRCPSADKRIRKLWYMYTMEYYSASKEHIWIGSNEVDETGANYTEWSKSERKAPIQYINTYIWNLERWWRWPYMRDSKRDTDVKNRLLDSVGEGEGGMIWENSTGTCMLPYMKGITSPGSMHETGAQGWCVGTTQRDGMGREVGQGFRMGTHVHPRLVHVNVWQKPLQCCKVISLQLEFFF